jgi:DNA-binding phage protein
VKIYKTYNFRNKDPVIDLLRTAIKDTGADWGDISNDSGVSTQTLHNWFSGTVKRPQFATVQAVAHSIGYDLMLVKSNRQLKLIKGGKQ